MTALEYIHKTASKSFWTASATGVIFALTLNHPATLLFLLTAILSGITFGLILSLSKKLGLGKSNRALEEIDSRENEIITIARRLLLMHAVKYQKLSLYESPVYKIKPMGSVLFGIFICALCVIGFLIILLKAALTSEAAIHTTLYVLLAWCASAATAYLYSKFSFKSFDEKIERELKEFEENNPDIYQKCDNAYRFGPYLK